MWNELLGFGDFYYELGVQLLEACLASRCARCLRRLLQPAPSVAAPALLGCLLQGFVPAVQHVHSIGVNVPDQHTQHPDGRVTFQLLSATTPSGDGDES
jgi:hypothetical protein